MPYLDEIADNNAPDQCWLDQSTDSVLRLLIFHRYLAEVVVIPLVRARYSAHFIDALQRSGAAIAPVLQSAGLSEGALEDPNGLTTIWQLGEVARLSAVRSGDLDLGWAAAETATIESYGSFSDHVLSGETLANRLKAFCEAANDEYSEATFSVVRCDRGLHFRRGPILGDEIGARQTELYIVHMMLSTVRSVLGPSWHPRRAMLQTFYRPETEACFDTNRTELRFDQPFTAIFIDQDRLASSLHGTASPNIFSDLQTLSTDTAGAIGSLLATYLGDHRMSLEFIAKISDMNPRTLQRALAKQNMTFSDLLSRHKVAVAIGELRNTDMTICEISYALGYTHQAHFSRAFRRETGLTPREYRQALRKH